MIDDIPDYTFQFANVFPMDNWLDVPPYNDFREVYALSYVSSGEPSTTEPMLLAIQSFYSKQMSEIASYDGGFRKSPGTPQIYLPVENESAFGYEPGDHTRLTYVFIPLTLPEIDSSSDNFFNWNKTFGSAVFRYLSVFNGNTWKRTIEKDTVDGETGLTTYALQMSDANFDAINDYWMNNSLALPGLRPDAQGHIPVVMQCKIAHVHHDSLDSAESLFDDAPELPTDMADYHNAFNDQVLVSADCAPLSSNRKPWKIDGRFQYGGGISAASVWYFGLDIYAKTYPKTNAWWATSRDTDVFNSSDGGIMYGATTNVVYNDVILDNIYKRYPSRSQVNTTSEEFVEERVKYIQNLLGNTLQVPKEYRFKRQESTNVTSLQLTSIGDNTDYTTENTATPITTTTTSISSYSVGSAGGGGGGAY